jgi:hypothetical protein
MARALRYQRILGVRVGPGELAKLESLCLAADRGPSAVVRLLIRIAEPTDLQPFRVGPGKAVGEEDGAVLVAGEAVT